VEVKGYTFAFGFNEGSKTVELINDKICRAIGVNIFLDGHIYFGHNYEITLLQYDSKMNKLCSCSEGRCS